MDRTRRYHGRRGFVLLAFMALALSAPLAALAQQPTLSNELIDRRTVTNAEVSASVVTASTIRSSNVFDSRIDRASVFTSSLDTNSISNALLRNDRVRLLALDRATVEDSTLRGVVATRTLLRNTQLDDFSIRGVTVDGGTLRNGVIQNVVLTGGVIVCNVYDRSTGRYVTSGCNQLGQTQRPENEVRDTARDLQATLISALTRARSGDLSLPQIQEQGFFERAEGSAPPSAEMVLADIEAGRTPSSAGEVDLPSADSTEAPTYSDVGQAEGGAPAGGNGAPEAPVETPVETPPGEVPTGEPPSGGMGGESGGGSSEELPG